MVTCYEAEKMAESPVRVLHVIGSTRRGGAESRIMDLYRCMDRSRVQFDFLIHEETAVSREDREASAEELSSRRTRYDFDEEIEELGGRIYALPSLRCHTGRPAVVSLQRTREITVLYRGISLRWRPFTLRPRGWAVRR